MTNKTRPEDIKFAVLATDVVVFQVQNWELNVLLTKARTPEFKDMWALPGGLIKPTEDVDKAPARYLEMLLGKTKSHIEQFHAFGKVNRDPRGRVVSLAYLALIPPYLHKFKKSDKFFESEWFNVKNVPSLAYDHNEILKTALIKLKERVELTNAIKTLMPSEFTLTELQNTYEIVLGEALDKRNFRKRVEAMDFLEKLDKKKEGHAHRPAQLYKIKS